MTLRKLNSSFEFDPIPNSFKIDGQNNSLPPAFSSLAVWQADIEPFPGKWYSNEIQIEIEHFQYQIILTIDFLLY